MQNVNSEKTINHVQFFALMHFKKKLFNLGMISRVVYLSVFLKKRCATNAYEGHLVPFYA